MKMQHTMRNRKQGIAASSNRRLLVRNQSVQDRRTTANSISDSAKKKPLPLTKTVSQKDDCEDLCGQESDDGVMMVEKGALQEDDGDNMKKIDQIHAMPASVPSIVEECREDDGHEDEDEEEEEEEEEIICDTKNKRMQSIVDLVMWRDASRSAFVFGIGSFLVISSSYTKDFNFSLISTFSYLCLLYLATIFLYTSIARCDGNNVEDRSAVLTEEDATQLISNLLPYINDILTKTKILFSGDPATTIKAAMPLFLLARYGGIVPISTMFKLAFFGAFTVPRFLSAYSLQIERYATFLLNRARDAWDTCTHKKAAAATTFVVLWNLFSPSARAWIVFMLLVLLRYSHQITGTSGLTIDIGITDDTMKNNSEMDPPVSQISECTDVLQ